MCIRDSYSIRTLGNPTGEYDLKAAEAVNSGLFLGILGLFTGMVWAKFTWGAFWVNDPKLNGTAVTILIYLAYIVNHMVTWKYRFRMVSLRIGSLGTSPKSPAISA